MRTLSNLVLGILSFLLFMLLIIYSIKGPSIGYVSFLFFNNCLLSPILAIRGLQELKDKKVQGWISIIISLGLLVMLIKIIL